MQNPNNPFGITVVHNHFQVTPANQLSAPGPNFNREMFQSFMNAFIANIVMNPSRGGLKQIEEVIPVEEIGNPVLQPKIVHKSVIKNIRDESIYEFPDKIGNSDLAIPSKKVEIVNDALSVPSDSEIRKKYFKENIIEVDDSRRTLTYIRMKYHHDWKKMVREQGIQTPYVAIVFEDSSGEIIEKIVYGDGIRVGKVLDNTGDKVVIGSDAAPEDFLEPLLQAMEIFNDLPSDNDDDEYFYVEEPNIILFKYSKDALTIQNNQNPLSDVFEITSLFIDKPDVMVSNFPNLRFKYKIVRSPNLDKSGDPESSLQFERI